MACAGHATALSQRQRTAGDVQRSGKTSREDPTANEGRHLQARSRRTNVLCIHSTHGQWLFGHGQSETMPRRQVLVQGACEHATPGGDEPPGDL